MIAPRRFLPSIASLRALEALDRLGSATAVAEELNLTQSAVSRQLQTLETQLGVTLITRTRRQMTLTPAAVAYAADVRAALQKIAQAALKLQVKPEGGTVNLAILPTFGMRWLVPRLADFARLHPDITINMSTRLSPFNFASEPFDAAIHFGTPDWPGTDHMRLRTERVIAVCAPSLLEGVKINGPEDVGKLPLLHIETRPDAWAEWLSAYGVAGDPLTGTLYDQFSTITQAALHGLGVALLPDYLAEQDLATGRLVRAWGGPIEMQGAYYLVWPKSHAHDPAVTRFRDWLATQSEDEDPLPR
ncbi:MAG: LysR family transcriptional regulator [Sediminimonas sp.]|uniref:LysR family transcriptional regulator n=1 Tax=Sediminimonas qiaohouensis TaxID=552061 RepID=A0A7C9HIR4_9RHOB|nr:MULTISPECIES: LysR family transcriptional regulator [Sediminimonas]MDR9485497.1 LysR family transcriptional regulator [Sediminimonas sp.]MTJ04412.1 LysR family transcriptional regulator [Sediminimonas qiaohouensis]